ncbi:MAG: triacylglycerol lipase [Deltaproteobacteria bacterium]
MPRHHVLLVPGFFGFGSLGDISYFAGVRQSLEQSFERAGVSVRVSEVATLPTASIRVRAARVREALAAIALEGEGPIHIIGHSTGGLDARLAIAPTASLPAHTKFEAYDRVRSLVTVCCAHFGSPVATFFSGWLGRHLLRVGARYLAWAFERGRVPLSFAFQFGYWLLGLWRPFQRQANTFDELFAKLIQDLSNERRAELVQFLRAVSSDEALVFQLTPAGCDLLNACTADPAVRYGSVVARSLRPTWGRFWRSFRDPYAQLVYPLYALLYRLAARQDERWIPEAVGSQRARLIEFWGDLPSPRDNDGISPTNSQIWGELVHATSADHLDVVGHFGGGAKDGRASDWLPSHSGFDSAAFARLWSDVASFLLGEALPAGQVPHEPDAGQVRTEHDLPKD